MKNLVNILGRHYTKVKNHCANPLPKQFGKHSLDLLLPLLFEVGHFQSVSIVFYAIAKNITTLKSYKYF